MSEEGRKRLVINAPGTLPRLPKHVEFLYQTHLSGILDRVELDKVIGSSAGVMALAACIGGLNHPHTGDADKCEGCKAFRNAKAIIGSLVPGKIFKVRRDTTYTLKRLAADLVAMILAVFFSRYLPWWGQISLYAVLVQWIWREGKLLGPKLLRISSMFDNDPLRELLLGTLDFREIFTSRIKFVILTTDIVNKKLKLFEYPDPEHGDPDYRGHRERCVDILLASARLPGKFPIRIVDGLHLGDGEIWTDFPIHQMRGYDLIVRLDYWDTLKPGLPPEIWMDDLTVGFDIMRDRVTDGKFETYEEQRKLDPSLPKVFRVRASETAYRAAESLVMHDFKKEQMQDLMEMAADTFKQNLPALRKYLYGDEAVS